MAAEFVTCEHPDLPGQRAVLPRSALRTMPGWQPVEDDAASSPENAPSGDGGDNKDAAPTRRRRDRSAPAVDPSTTDEE